MRARPGCDQLEADHAKYGLQGVKLYTAEWYEGSRGWKLTDPRRVPFLDKCVELGIKNIHVHKGPTIWPLDKDAFDVSDVDHVATDYNASSTSSSSTSACRGSRTSASWRRRSPTSTPACRSSSAA